MRSPRDDTTSTATTQQRDDVAVDDKPLSDGNRERRPKKPQPVVEHVPLQSVLTTSGMVQATRRPLAGPPKVPSNKVGTLEMYKRFPQEYDLLMAKHDCTQLNRLFGDLMEDVRQRLRSAEHGLRMIDLGCGTGRLLCAALSEAAARRIPLSLLIGYDKEAAMLRIALANMQKQQQQQQRRESEPDAVDSREATETITEALQSIDRAEDWSSSSSGTTTTCLRPFDFLHVRQGALHAPHPTHHIAVCAWSLSYVMRSCWGGDRWHQELRDTVDAIVASVVDGGAVVIIETLGNGCETPTRRNVMMEFLEAEYGFEHTWIRTDYVFSSVQEGEALCRFFFAHGVADGFREKGVTTLPECTGVWVKRVTTRLTVE